MINNLINKKIAILGLGVEGASTLRFLLKYKVKDITICDQKTKGQLKEKYAEFKEKPIKWRLGKNYFKNLGDFDIIFRSPGIPLHLSAIKKAIKKGAIISSQTKLFFELCPCPIIGVTGTKGKGTTSTLIKKIMELDKQKVFLGGNVGTPPLNFLDQLKPNHWVILELSSFQLQDLKQSPQIAVVLNITSDHLDYHENRDEYVKAKSQIVRHQEATDLVLVNADYETPLKLGRLSQAKKYYFSAKGKVDRGAYIKRKKQILLKIGPSNPKEICLTKDILLRGQHNWENITAAATAAYLAGAKVSAIKDALKTFSGLEYRLEFIKKINGVKYYNDSASTNAQTAIAALKAFQKPIILIAGGSSKDENYEKLGNLISQKVKGLILLGNEAAQKIKQASLKGGYEKALKENCRLMKQAVKAAQRIAQPGDIILLSPAAASFDLFKNYQDRGEQFNKAST